MQVGEVSLDILAILLAMTPGLDDQGEPIRPVPRAKRIMGSRRCLPYISQVRALRIFSAVMNTRRRYKMKVETCTPLQLVNLKKSKCI